MSELMDMSFKDGRHGNKVSSGPRATLHPPADRLLDDHPDVYQRILWFGIICVKHVFPKCDDKYSNTKVNK